MAPADSFQELSEHIHYSEVYHNDTYEYRHVILPKKLLKLIPANYFAEKGHVLRLLSDSEWRGIGVTQSVGWVHYEIHEPEPHILLFRRELNYQKKYGNAGRAIDQPQ